jgi:hypothetical protein
MTLLDKLFDLLTSQVNKSNVKLPVEDTPHKITDDNQSIQHGVIHEKLNTNMRSKSKSRAKHK